jgi:hypothetical protein
MGYILVVDDDPVIRRLLRIELEASGYAVEEASGGSEAIRQIRKGNVDLMVYGALPNRIRRLSEYSEAVRCFSRIRETSRYEGFFKSLEKFAFRRLNIKSGFLINFCFFRLFDASDGFERQIIISFLE